MFPALLILFFLSGASALVYQLLWLRLLGLVFGVTVHAASTVWAAFMAGLALGTAIAGIAGDHVRKPLVWFAAAEALTGLTAVLTPAAIGILQRMYVDLGPSLPQSGTISVAARFAIAFGVLIVPTALMGATMPLVVRSTAFGRQLGSRAGALYAANTGGAIAGTLMAGLYLVPTHGIRTAFIVAALSNVMVAAAAFVSAVTSSFQKRGGIESPATPEDRDTQPVEATPAQRTVVLMVFAVSGFVSLALEVIWFRIITLFVRPTVYGYAIMLATLLFGMALGSSVAASLLKWRQRAAPRVDRLLILGLLEGALAVTVLMSFTALAWVPWTVQTLGPFFRILMGNYLAYPAIVSLVVIFPGAVLFGVAFPIGLSVWLGERTGEAQVARRTGTFYSLNLTGAIAGSLAAGFLLLPSLGSRASLIGMAVITAIGAIACLWWSAASRTLRIASAVVCVAACALAATRVPDPFDEFLKQRYPDERIVWRREAVQATVSVHEREPGLLTLNVDGNHQASSAGSTPFVHRRIGNLPMAVHPDARRALVIGLGGGATAGALSRHKGVSVDVVELSREVVTAADRFFRSINESLLHQPHARLRVDDGRNYLLLTNTRYDVITADVILPIHAGASNLYSAEYFTLVRRALNPGGIAVQWVAGTEAEYKLIMRTFLSVFPETTLWADGTLMIGSIEPLRLRRSDFEWKLQVPERRQMLAELGITSFEKLLALYRAGPSDLRPYVGEGPVLTDDHPIVEYFLSLPRDRDVDLSGVTGDVNRHVDDGDSRGR